MRGLRCPRGSRGAALVWVVAVLALSLAGLLTLAGRLVAVYGATRVDQGRADARLLAENAVHLALAELNRDPAYAGATTPEAKLKVTTPGGTAPEGSPWYALEATDAGDWRQVEATVQLGKAAAKAGGTIRAVYHPAFPAGLFATDLLDLRDVTTDSYDSRQGDYRASRDTLHGDVGSFGPLLLHGTSAIHGNARPGPGHAFTPLPGTPVTGRTTPYPSRRAFPAIPTPKENVVPLKVANGKTSSLAAGTYATPDLALTDGTRVVVNGRVTIYVAGNVRLPAHALITHSPKAMDVSLVVSGGAVEIFPPFTGALYAPNATVTLHGPGEIYGAITARQIRAQGPLAVHFDRSLPYLSRGPRIAYRLLGWDREEPPKGFPAR